MSTYLNLLQAAKEGKRYKINLKTKSLEIGKKKFVDKGDVLTDEELININDIKKFGVSIDDIQNTQWKQIIWLLYKNYKYSVPDKKYKENSYFKAVDESELTDGERAFGISRKLAQAMLEGYILLGFLSGWIKWEDKEYWFWQSKHDKDLIILKDWIQ